MNARENDGTVNVPRGVQSRRVRRASDPAKITVDGPNGRDDLADTNAAGLKERQSSRSKPIDGRGIGMGNPAFGREGGAANPTVLQRTNLSVAKHAFGVGAPAGNLRTSLLWLLTARDGRDEERCTQRCPTFHSLDHPGTAANQRG